jgi:hypothetical protein
LGYPGLNIVRIALKNGPWVDILGIKKALFLRRAYLQILFCFSAVQVLTDY